MSEQNPYVPSEGTDRPDLLPGESYVYRSAAVRTTVLRVLFTLSLVWNVAVMGMAITAIVADVDNWGDFEFQGMLFPRFWVSYAALQLSWLPVYLTTAVVFCMWIHRCNANARALGAQEMQYTPGWCAGWFFIPFANLIKPYQAVRETWQACHPDSGDQDWKTVDDTAIVGAWWTLWIVTNMLSSVEERIADPENPDLWLASHWLAVVNAVLGVVLCLVVMKMVRGMQDRQVLKAERLGVVTPQATSETTFVVEQPDDRF